MKWCRHVIERCTLITQGGEFPHRLGRVKTWTIQIRDHTYKI